MTTQTKALKPSRIAFEHHWVKTRGKRARNDLQRHPAQPETYISDSANRHWVTWQAAQPKESEQEQIAVWLEKECDEQYLADRVRAGDYAKEKGCTENRAALADNCPDHLPPSLVGVGEIDSTLQPEQEPVAVVTGVYGGRFIVEPTNSAMVLPVNMALYAHPPHRKEPEQEPVAWFWKQIYTDGYEWKHMADNQADADKFLPHQVIPLYTTPPQRKPLTDEQDRAICEGSFNHESDAFFKAMPLLDTDENRRIFYAGHRRAWISKDSLVEAAHGIKE